MARNPFVDRQRAIKAHAVRTGDTARADQADRDLRAAKLEAHIARVVDAAPPLSETQKARLAILLLTPSTADGGPDA